MQFDTNPIFKMDCNQKVYSNVMELKFKQMLCGWC